MKVRKALTASLAIAVFMASGMVMKKLIADDYAEYVAESKCVKRYIRYKVERKDIITGNGTCSVKVH